LLFQSKHWILTEKLQQINVILNTIKELKCSWVPIFVDLFVGFKLLDSELINRIIIIIIIIMHFWINLKAFHLLRSKSKYWKAK
jgi:hypothetical protein